MSIRDLDLVESDPFSDKPYDVCICGAGPAGITLARKLSTSYSVLLLEAGGMSFTRESQDMYKGTTSGQKYFPLDHYRIRYFGGTSAMWGGACRLLDEEDFEKKPYMKYSGWPISKADLDPYVSETADILDVDIEADSIRYPIKSSGNWPPQFPGMEETEFHVSRSKVNGAPTRFGPKYSAEVRNNEAIDCYINATVVDIQLADDLSATDSFVVANNKGGRFNAKARIYIVATGGIENPRVLLNANSQQKTGVGNDTDMVGRCFAEHPHQQLGEFIFEDQAKKSAAADQSFNDYIGSSVKGRHLMPTKLRKARKAILGYSMGLSPSAEKQSNDEGQTFKAKIRSIVCSNDLIRDSAETLKGGAVSCFDNVDGYISIQSEQEPNPDSRITLINQEDSFGNKMLNLNWDLTDLDRKTLKSAAVSAAQAFAESSTGRVRLEHWLQGDDIDVPDAESKSASIVVGGHHLCSTRMSDSAETGVVDADQKVFGNSNLYMAGSSVFSTGGFSNPTFTIVQMTLRLADHLKTTLG